MGGLIPACGGRVLDLKVIFQDENEIKDYVTERSLYVCIGSFELSL